MKKKRVWSVAGVLILGLALLAVSCGAPAVEEPAPTAPAPAAPAEQPAVEEPATPTGGPPAIPHTLEGRDDCLVCHGEAGFKPFPADHAGRTSDICQGCHQPAE